MADKWRSYTRNITQMGIEVTPDIDVDFIIIIKRNKSLAPKIQHIKI
jgi:hypothetical protein